MCTGLPVPANEIQKRKLGKCKIADVMYCKGDWIDEGDKIPQELPSNFTLEPLRAPPGMTTSLESDVNTPSTTNLTLAPALAFHADHQFSVQASFFSSTSLC
jgi:hypothetical protein